MHRPSIAGDLTRYICGWMATLSVERPIFHSEADFQLALSTVMSRDPRVSGVRLERRVALTQSLLGRTHVNVDILARLDGRPVGIELKYPKRKLICTTSSDGQTEDFNLREGAADIDAAGFWRDAARIERLVAQSEILTGASVLLSNCPLWEPHRLMSPTTKGHAFALYEGRTITAGQTLAWREDTAGVDTSPVALARDYVCHWWPYSEVDAHSGEFRCIILEPPSGS